MYAAEKHMIALRIIPQLLSSWGKNAGKWKIVRELRMMIGDPSGWEGFIVIPIQVATPLGLGRDAKHLSWGDGVFPSPNPIQV
jgi:hypothetical protein